MGFDKRGNLNEFAGFNSYKSEGDPFEDEYETIRRSDKRSRPFRGKATA